MRGIIEQFLVFLKFGSLFALLGCGATELELHGDLEDALGISEAELRSGPIALQFGADMAAPVRGRVEALLRTVTTRQVQVLAADEQDPRGAAVVFAFGDTALARRLVAASELSVLGSEGFIVRSGAFGTTPAYAAVGNARTGDLSGQRIGSAFAAYALLEEMGFAFLHPLQPTLPKTFRLPATALNLQEKPHWKVRGIQLHTMHPLELTDLLNGWGPGGPQDEAGWRAMLPEWDLYMEWLLANRQNRVHWVLLHATSWAAFGDSDERLQRLKTLVDMGHAHGVEVGVDVPIALAQQHTFRLLRSSGTLESEGAEIRARIDWLMSAGFDYLATEAGFSEFTHPSADRMLAWMNLVSAHLEERHGKQAFIKIHCSTGQMAEGYTDPRTGEPLNFNFLPHYADPRLGVMPHTVQHYALDDQAPTYGNSNFRGIHEFMKLELGKRPVLWHPETAYWVSFDIDVPLFLPVYAERRVRDVRLIAADERAAGKRIDGQIIFSSGWEWGYWLNDVVSARSAWNPHADADTDQEAFRRLLRPVARAFGKTRAVTDWILHVARRERELLIEGRVGGVAPKTVVQRNGQAYLQGSETWDDVAGLGRKLGIGPKMETQPDKLGLVDMRNPFRGGPGYSKEIEPLLAEMEREFAQLWTAWDALGASVNESSRSLHRELSDAMKMTELRAKQVHGLYDYVDGYWDLLPFWRNGRLAAARKALDEAQGVVWRRESEYRVPAERIAGWRENPTAYEFTYLWTVRSLHYWWRDEGKAVKAPLSPCFMNIINPADVAIGEGTVVDLVRLVRWELEEAPFIGAITECLAETQEEPVYPGERLARK